jgi:hypothetical protein
VTDDPDALDWCDYNCGTDEYHQKDCPVAKELRGSWCTPEWLAKLIGPVDVDPCSNERSHIDGTLRIRLDDGGDGIHAHEVPGSFRHKNRLAKAETFNTVFCNPEYRHGEVERWVRHYRHTKFIYLLRWDPSTDWFSELIGHCTHVWFPTQRINFEPPPRIKASTNPFPHALYLRSPSPALFRRLAPHGYALGVDSKWVTPQSATHGHQPGNRGSGQQAGGGGAAGAGGEVGGWHRDRRASWEPNPNCISRITHNTKCCAVCT